MRFFGLEITRAGRVTRGELAPAGEEKSANSLLAPVDNRGGFWSIIRESFTGAWQQNVEIKLETVLSVSPVYRCISLISSDVAKMRVKLIEEKFTDIWEETESPSFTPVLRKPNRWQNRIQFFASWMISKLVCGNAIVLKERDQRGVVVALYVLDYNRVTVLVAEDGSVFYRVARDDLSGLDEDNVTIPASEIIHDRMNAFYHPLVGLSPIYACGLAAMQRKRIQSNSAQFFGNNSNPGGILTAPGAISDETAARLKSHWEANYSGKNAGKVAVLGDGLEYKPMAMSATDSQLVEQLGWTAEDVCMAFGVPPYKLGIGKFPTDKNVESQDMQYYTQCLQIHIESIELCLDEGLALPPKYGVEFDLDGLLRMDTSTLIKTLAEGVKGGLLAPNEGRRRMNMKPKPGGDSVYLQQQNFSLEALAKRDAKEDPFATSKPAAAKPAASSDASQDDAATAAEAAKALDIIRKELA